MKGDIINNYVLDNTKGERCTSTEKVKTCPFLSGTVQLISQRCTSQCALNIDGKCSFAIIAECLQEAD